MDWYGSMIILLPAILLSFYAQSKVSSTFNKYSKVKNLNGYTGRDIAESILRNAGLFDVRVESVKGNLTDHYDPRKKVVRLSDSVYNSTSIAAVGVAAHECGHALQDAKGYAFLKFRHAIFPVVSFSSNLAMPLIFLGFFLDAFNLIQLGVILFGAVVLFQLITLPVEFNASSRAIAILDNNNYLSANEVKPARKVLNAAALTYVAAAIVAIANLLRFLIILNGRRR
ncbi:hypothetical protein EDC18_101240 [Natranaerovirga pectinivora]|uniref:Zn-dependent protease n=1 Tax=Natranaerovirga pectinivora TaxID=682400 RepID=A0A4R3MQ76_9FIRM|nr:zinc metallopeptidase [Natranaerovirga pectinivora]TCT16944.1 hypothetical protein EDC18_101240 [Natranaerovirga pectinivora]